MRCHERKPNRLTGYDYSQTGAYFLTVCVKDRAEILGKIVGDGVLDVPIIDLTEYGKITEKYIRSVGSAYEHVWIEKFVIMPNHIHLIVVVHGTTQNPPIQGTSRTPSPTNAVIPALISTLKRMIHKEIGFPIFQRSYHDHIIRNEREYAKIWGYIDGNPLCWENDCFYPGNKG